MSAHHKIRQSIYLAELAKTASPPTSSSNRNLATAIELLCAVVAGLVPAEHDSEEL